MRSGRLILAVIGALLIAATGLSWKVEFGIIKGRVMDYESGEPLPGVSVQVEGTKLGCPTGFLGEYIIKGVPVGAHTLRISQVGRITIKIDSIIVSPDSITEVNSVLILDTLRRGHTERAYPTRDKLSIWQIKRLAEKWANIKGRVINKANGEPLKGASVIIQRIGALLEGASVILRGTTWAAITNDSGEYVIKDLMPGKYSLKCVLMGYEVKRIDKISIKAGKVKTADFQLSLMAGSSNGIEADTTPFSESDYSPKTKTKHDKKRTGSITGTVIDRLLGYPLPGAFIRIIGFNLGACSYPDGNFRINMIPPGIYSLEVTCIGFAPVTIKDIKIAAKASISIGISMDVSYPKVYPIIKKP